MAKVTLSSSAVGALKDWLKRATADYTPNPIPWLSWGSVTRGREFAEGWHIVLCPKNENLKPAIRIIDGIEMLVSEQSFVKHNVTDLRIDFQNGRFTFNGKDGV